MQHLVPIDPSLLARMGIDPEKFFSKRFKPTCRYIKPLDWFLYLAKDCSYVSTATPNPYLELLVDGGEVVGFKVMAFSNLPRNIRHWFTEIVCVDLDDIKGIEDLWIQNVEEVWPAIEAAQTAFFRELRRRETFYRYEVLHYPACLVDIRQRHDKLMRHLAALNPIRLP
jgi:hypothetical protein